MATPIETKSILSRVKNDTYFGIGYNMNLYRGCQHGCIYCDSRSICYQLGSLTDIRYKQNAIDLLTQELSKKRKRLTIGTGSMNDPYMPIEKKLELTRKALGVINRYRFPVHIITKGTLVSRDAELIQEIGKVYAAVSFTITTSDDALAKRIEPNAPSSSERFKAIYDLRKQGIYTGITAMPILPFINDTKQNVSELLKMAVDSGAQYVIPYFGVTLREGSRDYFYSMLDSNFPDIRAKYEKHYKDSYECNSPEAKALYELFYEEADRYGIDTKMRFYEPKSNEQLALF